MTIIEANGVDLCVDTFGDRADPALLLIHGTGNSRLWWDERLCERLATGGRFVIRYDVRDAGGSVSYAAGAPPYGLRDLVADAAGLLDALALERAHVLGLSTGGSIGQLLALDHPSRAASLILVSTTPGIPGEEADGLPGATPQLHEFFADEPSPPDWTDRAAVIDYLVESERPFSPRYDEPAMRDLYGRVIDDTGNLEASLTGVFMIDSGPPWRDRLAAITAPTLVIHGTEDPLFPYEHARALAREIPGAELLPVEDMGHEYFPPATWDVVVPAILRHTSA
jgi:pimeloyl-ACP methyl ester carboxylesterase